jgi:hypothetical protein
MKYLAACLVIFFCLLIPTLSSGSNNTYVVHKSWGGIIGKFEDKYRTIFASGLDIKIESDCLSACTLFMGVFPAKRVCITKRAIFGFHQAAEPNTLIPAPDGTEYLMRFYPAAIKKWIADNGGLPLPKDMIFMRWPTTNRYYRLCR